MLLAAACLSLGAGAGACTSSPEDAALPATSADPPRTQAGAAVEGLDPCTLLTTEEVQAGTGWAVGPGTHDEAAADTAGAVCNWQGADAEGAVHLQVHEGDGAATFAERRASLEGRAGPREPVDVAIDGARAAFHVAAEGLLAMVVGDDYVQLSVIGGVSGADDHLQLGADVARALG